MAKMGFATRQVDLIMAYVRSVSYSIVLNGKQCGKIVPFRDYIKETLCPLTYS